MSRCYICRVQRDVQVDDEMIFHLHLLGILPPDLMAEELASAMARLGATGTPAGTWELEVSRVVIEVNPHTLEAFGKAGYRHCIVQEKSLPEKPHSEEVEERVRKKLERDAADRESSVLDALRRKGCDLLKREETAIREVLRRAVNETHKGAFHRKAALMGRIVAERDEALENGGHRLTLVIDV